MLTVSRDSIGLAMFHLFLINVLPVTNKNLNNLLKSRNDFTQLGVRVLEHRYRQRCILLVSAIIIILNGKYHLLTLQCVDELLSNRWSETM